MESITAMGINNTLPVRSRRRISKSNEILLVIFSIVFIWAVYCVCKGMYYSFAVYLVTILLILISFRLNTLERFEQSKILSFVNVNLGLIFLNRVEGLDAGIYNYFFPYFLILTFIVNIEKQKKTLIIYYLQALISCGICFIVSPRQSELQPVPAAEYDFMFTLNMFLSLLVTLMFSYMIIKVNKKNESSILQEKKYFNTIFNTANDSILIVNDVTNMVENCNSTALKMFGIERKEEMIDTHFQQWIIEEQVGKFTSGIKQLDTANKSWHDELLLIKENGESFFAYVHVLRFTYKNATYKKINVFDTSDIKSTEFELMQAKQKAEAATRAKSRFLSSMSHELRTPLNGIIGSANLLLQEDYLPDQRKHLDILRYSSEHMLQLINHILDFSKIEAGKIDLNETAFNLKQLLGKITPQFAQQAVNKNIKLETSIPDDIDLDILADETRLYQVVNNLLANAVKFTTTGGVIFTVKKMFTSSHIASIQFLVTDTGIGIPADKQKDIFRNFTQADSDTTRKYGGTGLGLAICKRLLQMMGSDLLVESELGKGSTFHFTIEFKVSQERRNYINEEKSKSLPPLKGIKILVAEDNPINMSIARRFMEKWDITVTEAVNGRIAAELFEKGKFDLVLIDLEMPELDGLAALRKIREKDSDIPAIAFTAAVYDNIQVDLMNKGFDDFVHKPFRPEDLHAKISKNVNGDGKLKKRA
jgi:PAS domain S-box-containing protein